MVIVVVMVAACAVLVAISYLMLDILSGMVVAPKTPVREMEAVGELVLPNVDEEVLAMELSGDGGMLALLGVSPEADKPRIRVLDLARDGGAVFEAEVSGRRLAWLGDSRRLAYEDGGDILILDLETRKSRNLTPGTEMDYDPLPTPDGRYILWTRSAREGEGSGGAQLWVMDPERGDAQVLAPRAEPAAWDPAGGRVVSGGLIYDAKEGAGPEYYLQVAAPGGLGWQFLASCEGEPLFLWWPAQGEVVYVAPWRPSDRASYRAVWFRVRMDGKAKKVATSESLGDDASHYRFYPSRSGDRVAYIGDAGLEYLDYDAGRIYRFTRLSAACPLAWDEVGGRIFYCGEGGIYAVPLQED